MEHRREVLECLTFGMARWISLEMAFACCTAKSCGARGLA
jgi:hypothetical protein